MFTPAKADQFRKRVLIARFNPELRRTAHAQRGVFRERFVKPHVTLFTNNRFQFLRNHEISGQDRQLLVNVARTHAQNEIAGVEHVSDIAMDPFKTRLITHSAMSMTRDFVSDRLATDARDWGLARGIDIGHNNAVGVIKRASEFMTQRFGSRKTMRLKHRQDAFTARRSCRLERGANFTGMMRVIIDQQKTIAGVFYFEPPPGVLKFAKGICNFFKRNPKFARQCDYPDGVVDVVLSGNIQYGFT